MKKIKVGFLPLYIKLYDDANGVGYRAPMEKYMHMAINMLEAYFDLFHGKLLLIHRR